MRSGIPEGEIAARKVYELSCIMHRIGIPEENRPQLAATLTLAVMNGVDIFSENIRKKIRKAVESSLRCSDCGNEWITYIYDAVMEGKNAPDENGLKETAEFIRDEILPNVPQDTIVYMYFTVFSRYVGRGNRNQAFTPPHISHFIAEAAGAGTGMRVLDSAAGCGTLLAGAPAEEKECLRYGIEYDVNIEALGVTSMMICGSMTEFRVGSCFDMEDWIVNHVRPQIILENPPFACLRKACDPEYVSTWSPQQRDDPSKGLIFAEWLGRIFRKAEQTAELAIILPVACALGKNAAVREMKKRVLESCRLKAVFTLPDDIFYPEASTDVCAMIFTAGVTHDSSHPVYFCTCRDDGFRKKKGVGRCEQYDSSGKSLWKETEKKWLEAYREKRVEPGMSAIHAVGAEDEWLAEAYIETDYSKLTMADFEKTACDYLKFLMERGGKR